MALIREEKVSLAKLNEMLQNLDLSNIAKDPVKYWGEPWESLYIFRYIMGNPTEDEIIELYQKPTTGKFQVVNRSDFMLHGFYKYFQGHKLVAMTTTLDGLMYLAELLHVIEDVKTDPDKSYIKRIHMYLNTSYKDLESKYKNTDMILIHWHDHIEH